ncbi:MAG: protein tyrosine phosphatase [Pyrinomonadaceae bacterium]
MENNIQVDSKTEFDPAKILYEKVDIKAGNISANTAIYKKGSKFPFYFNLHGNEKTSVEAVKKIISDNEGTLVELNTNGERLVRFSINNNSYSFDPNRIFTPLGIQKTLKKYDSFTPETEKEVNEFAERIINDFLTDVKIIIAVHNNTDGNYSILSYEDGGEFEKDSAQVYVNPDKNTDDFFLVTNETVFQSLKQRKFNVILQDNNNVTDDGSLSVYCAKNNILYINVESEHNYLDEQIIMLQNLKEVIPNL